MAFDAHRNFAYSAVSAAPQPAASGPNLSVRAGDGSRFPVPPFNAVIWPAVALPLAANAEVVRVTAINEDTLTILRAQEGSTARQVMTGDQIAAAITTKTLTDIEQATAGTLQAAQNLGDLASASQGRVNLGLGSAATQNVTAFAAGLTVASVATTAGALAPNKLNPVDATSGALTMTLPTGQLVGTIIQVEKEDTTTNAVAVTGSIRGVGSSTMTIALAKESIEFIADASGSWWPIAGHKTLGTLDARYIGAGSTVVSGGNLGATYTLALPSRDVLLVATLTANTTITVTGLATGSHFRLLLTQDATGGRTPTLSDGTNTLALTLPSTAAAASALVDCWSPNGTDIVVSGA